MREIIIQGRGGQGAQTAGNLLARAYFAGGRQVQAFATYGGARRGTPVSSFLRVADHPIRLRCDIERADAILCFDASLLQPPLLSRAGERTLIVVNSGLPAAQLRAQAPGLHVVAVDAVGISRGLGLGRIVNSALIGGLARAVGDPSLAVLEQLLRTDTPKLRDENVAACIDGYKAVDAQLTEAA